MNDPRLSRSAFEYYAKSYGIVVIIAVVVVIALLPIILRLIMGAPLLLGAESYAQLRETELVMRGDFIDPIDGQRIVPSTHHLFVALMDLFGVPWLLSPLLAALLLLLLIPLLGRVTTAHAPVVLAVIIVGLSPTMSVLGTTLAPLLLAIVFLTLALLAKRPWHAAIAGGAAALTDPVGILGCIVIIGYRLLPKFRHKGAVDQRAIAAGIAAGVGALWWLAWGYALRLPVFAPHWLFELGKSDGVSVFLLIIAGYGISLRIREPLAIVTIFVALLSFVLPVITLPAVVLLALFAAYGIIDLIVEKWSLDLARQALLVLLLCAGLFLIITTIKDRVEDEPSLALARSLISLRHQSQDGAVLADPRYAPIVAQYAGRRAAMLPPSIASRDAQALYGDLSRQGVRYVLVDDALRSRFTRSDEGMLFIIENSARFVLLEERDGQQIWYFIA